MTIRVPVDQAESIRRGVNAPHSSVEIAFDPANLTEGQRAFIHKNLVGGCRLNLPGKGRIPTPDLAGLLEAIAAYQGGHAAISAPRVPAEFFLKRFRGDLAVMGDESLMTGLAFTSEEGDCLWSGHQDLQAERFAHLLERAPQGMAIQVRVISDREQAARCLEPYQEMARAAGGLLGELALESCRQLKSGADVGVMRVVVLFRLRRPSLGVAGRIRQMLGEHGARDIEREIDELLGYVTAYHDLLVAERMAPEYLVKGRLLREIARSCGLDRCDEQGLIATHHERPEMAFVAGADELAPNGRSVCLSSDDGATHHALVAPERGQGSPPALRDVLLAARIQLPAAELVCSYSHDSEGKLRCLPALHLRATTRAKLEEDVLDARKMLRTGGVAAEALALKAARGDLVSAAIPGGLEWLAAFRGFELTEADHGARELAGLKGVSCLRVAKQDVPKAFQMTAARELVAISPFDREGVVSPHIAVVGGCGVGKTMLIQQLVAGFALHRDLAVVHVLGCGWGRHVDLLRKTNPGFYIKLEDFAAEEHRPTAERLVGALAAAVQSATAQTKAGKFAVVVIDDVVSNFSLKILEEQLREARRHNVSVIVSTQELSDDYGLGHCFGQLLVGKPNSQDSLRHFPEDLAPFLSVLRTRCGEFAEFVHCVPGGAANLLVVKATPFIHAALTSRSVDLREMTRLDREHARAPMDALRHFAELHPHGVQCEQPGVPVAPAPGKPRHPVLKTE